MENWHTWTGWTTAMQKIGRIFLMQKLWGVGNSLDTWGMTKDIEKVKECLKSITNIRVRKGVNGDDNAGKTGKNGKKEGRRDGWSKKSRREQINFLYIHNRMYTSLCHNQIKNI